MLRATTACTFSTSEPPKVARKSKCTKHTSVGPLLEVEMSKKCTPLWRKAHFQVNMYKTHQLRTTFGSWDVEKVHGVVARSTFPSQNVQNTTCASRHNGVHFFDISTAKSGPKLVLIAFWLRNVLRATTACTFSTSQLPKVVRAWCVCTFWLQNVLRATTACKFSSLIWPAGSAPAALASLLFDPPEPQIIGKTPVFRDFPIFSRICIFFLLALSLLIFSLLIFLFSLPLPCFSSVHIVGSLTSKLPSISWTFHD